jgi:hypothetical protein
MNGGRLSDVIVHDKTGAAGEALKAKGEELSHGAKADASMEAAKDPNRPITERVAEAASGVKEKVAEVTYHYIATQRFVISLDGCCHCHGDRINVLGTDIEWRSQRSGKGEDQGVMDYCVPMFAYHTIE